MRVAWPSPPVWHRFPTGAGAAMLTDRQTRYAISVRTDSPVPLRSTGQGAELKPPPNAPTVPSTCLFSPFAIGAARCARAFILPLPPAITRHVITVEEIRAL